MGQNPSFLSVLKTCKYVDVSVPIFKLKSRQLDAQYLTETAICLVKILLWYRNVKLYSYGLWDQYKSSGQGACIAYIEYKCNKQKKRELIGHWCPVVQWLGWCVINETCHEPLLTATKTLPTSFFHYYRISDNFIWISILYDLCI